GDEREACLGKGPRPLRLEAREEPREAVVHIALADRGLDGARDGGGEAQARRPPALGLDLVDREQQVAAEVPPRGLALPSTGSGGVEARQRRPRRLGAFILVEIEPVEAPDALQDLPGV